MGHVSARRTPEAVTKDGGRAILTRSMKKDSLSCQLGRNRVCNALRWVTRFEATASMSNNLWKSTSLTNTGLAFDHFFIESNPWPVPIPIKEDNAGGLKDVANKRERSFRESNIPLAFGSFDGWDR